MDYTPHDLLAIKEETRVKKHSKKAPIIEVINVTAAIRTMKASMNDQVLASRIFAAELSAFEGFEYVLEEKKTDNQKTQ